ncbi:MAG: ribonuclease III [Firmicutes bacterium]|nr:ribonuclease III [Bacillota bacterium]MDH7496008.1 ribonuclease III domain-containing protein [Bacillota bacterium]
MVPLNSSSAESVERLPAGVLAYVGDAVYELYVRTCLVRDGRRDLEELHREAVMRVNAKAQARTLAQLDAFLHPDELEIARRARNAHTGRGPGRGPRGATVLDYRHSTGFEAVLGYLYLQGREDRLGEVLEKALSLSDENRGGQAP